MARRKFYRNTITLVVYTENERLDKTMLDHEDVIGIVREAIEGRYIGDVKDTKSERVKTMKQLRRELIRIGNDGTFFSI